jgi:hypothetical protein
MERKSGFVLAAIALAVGALTLVMPVCAPVAIVLGCLAFVQSKSATGKIASIGTCVMGGLSIALLALSAMGLLGLQGAALCCGALGSGGQ